MKKPLLILLCLIAFICATRLWQLNIGIRLFGFDALAVIFSGLYLLDECVVEKRLILKKEIKYYLVFIWGWVGIAAASSIFVFVNPMGEEALSQYLKGFLSVLGHTVFFTLCIFFLSRIGYRQRRLVLTFFIGGVIFSCLYEFAQIMLLQQYGLDLDALIWDRISYNTSRESATDFIKKYEWGSLYRGTGLAGGPNPQAAYIVTVLPILFVNAMQFKWRNNMILIVIAAVALLITMSRSGWIAFGVAAIVLLGFASKRRVVIIKSTLVLALFFSGLAYFYWEYVLEFAPTRIFFDSSRIALYWEAFGVFEQHPLGIGLNNFSVAQSWFSISESNAHNSWLGYLVEVGIVGLLYQIAFITFVCYQALRHDSLVSKAMLASVVGLSIASFLNNFLDLFFFQFYLTLIFSLVILDANPVHSRQPSGLGRTVSFQGLPGFPASS